MIKVSEHGIDDSVTTAAVLEVSHDFESSPDLSERAFDDIGSSDHLADLDRELKHRNQFVEISLQAGHRFGNELLPAPFPNPEAISGNTTGGCRHDLDGLTDTVAAIPFVTIQRQVAEFVDPAELMFDMGINRLDRGP